MKIIRLGIMLFVLLPVSFLFANVDYQIYSYGQPFSDLTGQGNCLYMTNVLGITKYNTQNQEKTFMSIPGFNPEIVREIVVDSSENVWFLSKTDENVIIVNCLNNGIITVYNSGITENTPYYLKLYMDNSDNLWIGTYSNGLLQFNTDNLGWTQFNPVNTGVDLNKISVIFQDVTDASLWVGTWDYGLFHYQNNTWTQITSMNGISINFITDIDQFEDGTLWIGTHDGLLRIMNQLCEQVGDYYKVEEIETIGDQVYFSCYESDLFFTNNSLNVNNFEIGNLKDLFAFNGHLYVDNYFALLKSGNPGNYCNGFDLLFPGNYNNQRYFDQIRINPSDNSLWTKNSNSLSVRKNNTWTYFNQDNTNIDFTNLINFNFTQDNQLICLMQEENQIKFIRYDGINWIINPPIASQKYYNDLIPDNNQKIWLTSFDNKLHYSENNQIYQISLNHNLVSPNNSNCNLSIDQENNIWFQNYYNLFYYNQNTDQTTLVRSNVKNYCAVNPEEYYYISNDSLYFFNNNNIINYGAIPEYTTQMKLDSNQHIGVLGAFNYYTVENSDLMVYDIPLYNNCIYKPSFAIDSNNNKFYSSSYGLIAFNETQAVSGDESVISQTSDRIRVYPNPFNPDTHISFTLHQANSVEINIYNIKGQLVKSYPQSYFNAGEHTLFWNGKDNQNKTVSSGIYFIRLISPEYQGTKKAMLLK
ncbi:MAG: T9SS type A sorting domain-containing protein [Candidatus Cloacimonetes bacterium]|nr:T9SS type A sorting domain-containing protein [Candidatus Cloacimonadota bacterium]